MARKALLAAGLCLLLAGCGRAGPAVAPPSRAAFDARADRVCAEARTRSELYAGLRRLRAPAGGQEAFARLLRAARATFTRSRLRVDPTVLRAVAEGKFAGYAVRLGAERCAQRTIGTMPP